MTLGLRGKYAVSTSVLIIVVVLALSTALLWHFRDVLGKTADASVHTLTDLAEDQLTNHGLEFGHMVAQNVASPFQRMDRERMHEVLRDARYHHSVDYLLLFDAEGRIVLDGVRRNAPDFGMPVANGFVVGVLDGGQPAVRHGDGVMDVVVPVEFGATLIGGLWIGYSREMLNLRMTEVRGRLAGLRNTALREELTGIAVLTVALLIIGVLVALELAKRLTNPILRLADSAVRIGRAESAEIDVSRDDEVGDLASALALMQESLQQTTVSKEYLLDIIHSLNEGLLVAGPDMRIRVANRAMWDQFGYRDEDLLGEPIAHLIEGPEACRRLAVWNPELDHSRTYQECRLLAKSGDSVPVAISLAYLRGGGTQQPGAVFVVQDISERRRMEEELHLYRENLEQLVAERTRELSTVNRELESFSYSVSHDLRTPLRALNGFSQMLWEDYGDRLDPDARSYLERIRQSSQRMSEMIDGLLTLSRVVRREIQHEPVELSRVAAEVVEELRSGDPSRQATVHVQPGLHVVGDEALLRLLLQNLLSNAWKFTAHRGDAVIEFVCREEQGRAVFFVRDNGAGFDMGEAGTLFQPFQRLHTEREYEGTGIGLATAARIVGRHGGRVWAEAERGRGATFFFTLAGASPLEQ